MPWPWTSSPPWAPLRKVSTSERCHLKAETRCIPVIARKDTSTCHALQVQYGLSPSALTNTAAASSQAVNMNNWAAVMNQAVMTSLTPNTTYYYRVGSDAAGWSQVYDFINQPARNGGAIYAVYADFGYKNDESLSALIADANAGGFDYVVHADEYCNKQPLIMVSATIFPNVDVALGRVVLSYSGLLQSLQKISTTHFLPS